MKVSFIGGGNMAVALIGGMKTKGFSAAGIQVVEPSEEARQRLTAAFGVRTSAVADPSFLSCEVLMLAVKPQQMRMALLPLAGNLGPQQMVISIAAGVRLAEISRWLGGHRKIVRTMPNTPALIGAGISGLYADPSVDPEGRDRAEKILGAVGQTIWLQQEAQMDGITAISGSGPAYVFYFMEALEAAAGELGFGSEEARQLAVDTFLGAAKLAANAKEPLAVLRERVTSKGGTTEAALKSFATDHIEVAIGRGVRAAAARGRELGDLLSKE